MVKNQGSSERGPKQAEKLDDGRETERVVKITAETPYGECSKRLTAFGGLLMLLFIGFQRVRQFVYIRTDAMLCGILRVTSLPVVSIFWRYLRSMGIVQSGSILCLSGALLGRVWELCAYRPQ